MIQMSMPDWREMTCRSSQETDRLPALQGLPRTVVRRLLFPIFRRVKRTDLERDPSFSDTPAGSSHSKTGCSQLGEIPGSRTADGRSVQGLFSAASCSSSKAAMHSSTVAPFNSSRTIKQVFPHCSTFIPALDART